MNIEHIKKSIRNVPDFPKPGIQFKDITTLLQNLDAFGETIDFFYNTFITENIDVIVSSLSGNEVLVTYNETGSDFVQPESYGLTKIYPNPFNPSTEVEFALSSDAHILLSVYDLNGRQVDTIFEGFQTSGLHSYRWNASELPSGVYYVKLQFENQVQTMKAVLVK